MVTGLPGIQMKEQLLVYFVEQQQNSLQEENSTVGFHLQPPVYTRTSKLFVPHPQGHTLPIGVPKLSDRLNFVTRTYFLSKYKHKKRTMITLLKRGHVLLGCVMLFGPLSMYM
jgi:hypothetical protein